jgi:spore germination protein YaaH
MLTKLLPDQISKFWPVVKYAVEQSLPPTVGEHPDKMNRMLSAMLRGELEVWVSYQHPENRFEAVVVTQFIYDDASNMKNLLLYCVYGYSNISESSWMEAWDAMNKYAKGTGCKMIVCYSANPFIVKQAQKFGGDTSYTFISFNI